MKLTTTWAVFGSLVINLALGLLIAAVFSVAPAAKAAEPAEMPARTTPSQDRSPPPAPTPKQDHVVAVRMGWAV